MKSSAVIGVPSCQTAFGLITYVIVCGFEVTLTLVTNSVLRTSLRAPVVMYTVGQTKFIISWRTNSFEPEVLMLNPASVSSRAIVAVPPVLTEACDDSPEAPDSAGISPNPNVATPNTPTASVRPHLNLLRIVIPPRPGFAPARFDRPTAWPAGQATIGSTFGSGGLSWRNRDQIALDWWCHSSSGFDVGVP